MSESVGQFSMRGKSIVYAVGSLHYNWELTAGNALNCLRV